MVINKTKSSIYNSITSLLFTLINGLCNLIVVRKLIETYGSDFNGLNSTAAQFISVLLIIEGGFAVAANVALFRPLSQGDKQRINSIVSAINKKFNKISFAFLLVGGGVSVIFALLVKSEYEFYIKFGVFIFLIISTWFNLYYSTKYKILIQSDQKEYILNIISCIFLLLSNGIMYVMIVFKWHPLLLRAVVMLSAIMNSVCVGIICKAKYPYINTKATPNYASIKGTTDVFVQKIVGVIYASVPIIFISVFVSTVDASIYTVYNTVITLIKSIETAVINAPRMSLGYLIAENDLTSERVKKVYNEYEFTAIFSASFLLGVTMIMIMPFISIYSAEFTDASYSNWNIAILLIITCLVECIHIPSGVLITMSGKFKEGKKIQIVAGVVLLVTLSIGVIFGGMNGIIVAVLLTAIVLAFMEIIYAKKVLLKDNLIGFVKNLAVNVVANIILIIIGLSLNIIVNSFLEFFVIAFFVFIVNALAIISINYIFCRKMINSVMSRICSIVFPKARKNTAH